MDEQQLEAINKEIEAMAILIRSKVLHRFTGELDIAIQFNQGGIRSWARQEKEKMK